MCSSARCERSDRTERKASKIEQSRERTGTQAGFRRKISWLPERKHLEDSQNFREAPEASRTGPLWAISAAAKLRILSLGSGERLRLRSEIILSSCQNSSESMGCEPQTPQPRDHAPSKQSNSSQALKQSSCNKQTNTTKIHELNKCALEGTGFDSNR